MNSSRCVATIVGALSAWGAAGAQRPAAPTRADSAGARVVGGAPGSIQIAQVRIPSELRAAGTVSYELRAIPPFQLLGAARGEVPASRASILVTVMIPRSASHGRFEAATLLLRAPRSADVERRVVIDVARVRAASVRLRSARTTVRPGDAVALSYEVRNDGNGVDSLRLHARASREWRVSTRDTTVHLAPGESVERVVRAHLGFDVRRGDTRIALVATAGSDSLGATFAVLRVRDRTQRAPGDGPVLTLGVASGQSASGRLATGYRVRLGGSLMDGVALQGEIPVGPMPPPSASALYGLGYTRPPFRLMLQAPSWSADFGQTGSMVPELAGASLFGRGFAVTTRGTAWGVTALAARPTPSAAADEAQLFLGVDRMLAGLTVGGMAAHLTEGPARARTLDALGGRVLLTRPGVGSVSTEIAARRSDHGSGLGWSTVLDRRTERGSLFIRAMKAPGGSSAFARAADDYYLNGSHTLTDRFILGGTGWLSRDGARRWRNLHRDGGALRGSMRVGHGLTTTLEGRQASTHSDGSAGATDDRERAVAAAIDFQRGTGWANVSATAGSIERGVTTVDGLSSVLTSPRRLYQGNLGFNGRLGEALLTGMLDRSQSVGGLPVGYDSYGLLLRRLPVFSGNGMAVVGSAQATLNRISGRSPTRAYRLGARMSLPWDVAVRVVAERNDYAAMTGGRGGWMLAAEVERDLRLPAMRRHVGGVVYRDVNGNGRRDDGEPGVPGVIVRRADTAATTDRAGRYRFIGAAFEPPTLDITSIPAGLVHRGARAADYSRGDFGLTPVSAVRVTIALAAGDELRVTDTELAAVQVFATDTSGRSWLARTLRAGDAVFEGMPPGHYTLSVHGTASREPLTVQETPPPLDIADGVPAPPIRLVLRVRPLVVRQFAQTNAVSEDTTGRKGGASADRRGDTGPAGQRSGARMTYVIQVGAFETQDDAERFARRLFDRGFHATPVAESSRFRVLVGPYATRALAEAGLKSLRSVGVQGRIRDTRGTRGGE